jgi:NAD(P)-dependent dehydrogenase (short-subunit alcohol dehydrogenase family)
VRSKPSVVAGVATAVDWLGGLDTLVQCAGVFDYGALGETSEDSWDRQIDTNLKGTFLVAQAAMPHVVASGRGRVVNIASEAGRKGWPLTSAYNASKFGVVGLTQTWAREFGRDGVTVNCVCPAMTPETRQGQEVTRQKLARTPGLTEAEVLRGYAENFPVGRAGTVADTADAIMFFLTDNASWITAVALRHRRRWAAGLPAPAGAGARAGRRGPVSDGRRGNAATPSSRPGPARLPRRRHDPRPDSAGCELEGRQLVAKDPIRIAVIGCGNHSAARSSRASRACRTSTTSRRATSTRRPRGLRPALRAPARSTRTTGGCSTRSSRRRSSWSGRRSSTSRRASRPPHAGIHLFVEKPSAPSSAEAQELADASRSGRIGMVGLFWRHAEAFQRPPARRRPGLRETLLFERLYLSPGPRSRCGAPPTSRYSFLTDQAIHAVDAMRS